MRSGNSAGVADLSSNQLTNLQNSLNSLSSSRPTWARPRTASRWPATRIQGLQNSDTAALSNDEDVDMARP